MADIRTTQASEVAVARASISAEADDWRLRPPQPPARLVQRDGLVHRLLSSADTRVVVILAPAGYGKSTVLRQVLEPRAALALTLVDRLGAELEGASQSRLNGEPPAVAERRVLDLLPTHAPLQEIAETLFVSRNTVKSHTLSLYRKLDVSSRSDAVSKARALGLLRGGT